MNNPIVLNIDLNVFILRRGGPEIEFPERGRRQIVWKWGTKGIEKSNCLRMQYEMQSGVKSEYPGWPLPGRGRLRNIVSS
jgi:hypothetical protein